MGRAARQVVTTDPQKSADAIVVIALKLVGDDEGQNLTHVKLQIAKEIVGIFIGYEVKDRIFDT